MLPDSFSNLGGATQAVADGALPPISDIQTLNELSSGGADEVQTAHNAAHGGSMAFYPADNADQNFASGTLVANAANAQGAAPNALGAASITGLPVPTEVAITTAGMTSVALLDNPAPGTAIAIPASYDWQGFAVSGSQTSTSQSGTGSSVVAVTSGGITIDLIFDAAAMAAPASFRTGIEQAASLIAAAVSDKITVNINIDYSGTGGGAAAGPDNGLYESYSSIRTDLINNATPGDTIFNALPSGSSIQGQSSVAVWNAQLKLFGLLSPNSTTTDDGSATFATDIQSNLLVGVAVHELTHAMGRVPYGSAPDIFDLFRFTSAGNYLFSGNIPAPAAYFSVNGGNTNLAYYGLNSDPSDFLNVSPNLNDPFDEYYSSNTTQTLTPLDLEQLDALGFHLTPSTPSTVSVAYFIANESSLNSIAGGFAISDTAANVQANLAALSGRRQPHHIDHGDGRYGHGRDWTVCRRCSGAQRDCWRVCDFGHGGQCPGQSGCPDGGRQPHHIDHGDRRYRSRSGLGCLSPMQRCSIRLLVGLRFRTRRPMSRPIWLPWRRTPATSLDHGDGWYVTVGTGAVCRRCSGAQQNRWRFAISDTAANIQANLAALAADVSHITSITSTSGTVTVGTAAVCRRCSRAQ